MSKIVYPNYRPRHVPYVTFKKMGLLEGLLNRLEISLSQIYENFADMDKIEEILIVNF